MSELITAALKYIYSSFFIECTVVRDINDEVPFQIRKSTSSFVVEMEGNEFSFIATEKPDLFAENNFLNIKKINAKSDRPLVIVSRELSNDFIRLSILLNCGIVIPGNYVRIPSLLIHGEVKEISYDRNKVDTEKPLGIIPSYLIAYYLSGEFKQGFNSGDMIDILEISKMSVSRAVKELLASNFIEENGSARYRNFYFSKHRKEIWDRHRQRISPLSTGFMPVDKDKFDTEPFFMPVRL